MVKVNPPKAQPAKRVDGTGSYTIKKIGHQEYLYRIITNKDKQKWQTLGNVKTIDPKDPNLLKARAVASVRDARAIIENCLTGKIDKTKAKTELSKVIDRVCP